MLGKEANEYYYKNEERAFQDLYVGGEKELIMWARIYSEDVLHRPFEPISDFMVLDKIEQSRDTENVELFYTLSSGFALLEFMAADKGFGGGRNIGVSPLKGNAAYEAAKELGFTTRVPLQKYHLIHMDNLYFIIPNQKHILHRILTLIKVVFGKCMTEDMLESGHLMEI